MLFLAIKTNFLIKFFGVIKIVYIKRNFYFLFVKILFLQIILPCSCKLLIIGSDFVNKFENSDKININKFLYFIFKQLAFIVK